MGAVNDIYELRIVGVRGGQEIQNTLHFQSFTVGTDASQQQDLIDSWQASSQASYLALMHSDYTLSYLQAARVCGSTPLPAPNQEAVNLTGTRGAIGAGDALPPWAAALVREKTAFRGREYAGRFFLNVSSDLDVSGTSLMAAYLTLVGNYITSLGSYLVGGADADWDLFVRSRKLAAQPGVQCQNTGAGVLSLSASPYLTTMRSRRSRTGA